ncbi:hypothetical protein GYMLUDRAFT_87253 [Collybiopsis luxurians FD-317 M1]|uniref:Uncharacterized protein n=1 Tax=Collybiopsis luxurians FD-317 M1 TaxID=944289 RepID=A0A0D0CET0_9AGAR|nr:hypothetical protein GYMLUDRAFT_87253 [Collybiopsis luxurians FD-317 M1]
MQQSNLTSALLYYTVVHSFIISIFCLFSDSPFTFDTSDGLKELLKFLVGGMTFLSAVISFSFLSLSCFISLSFLVLRWTIDLVIYFRPHLKAITINRAAERKARREAEDKDMPSKSAVSSTVFLYIYIGTTFVLGDLIVHHPKGSTTFKDGLLPRFVYLCDKACIIVYVQVLALTFNFLLAIILFFGQALVYHRRQQRALSADPLRPDKENYSIPAETTAVPPKKNFAQVLEERLTDLSDGMDAMYEKVAMFVVPPDARIRQDKESLIKV